VIMAAALVCLAGLSYPFPFLAPFRESLFTYLGQIWWAIALGLFLGGVIDHYVPRAYISRVLAGSKRRTVAYAVVLGFLMSACSHGILAIAIQLHKKGASSAAVVAFLLASPWANLTLSIVLISLFGLKALYIIGAAIVIALITGLLFQRLEAWHLVETNPNAGDTAADFSVLKDLRQRVAAFSLTTDRLKADAAGIWRGAVSLGNMVLWWILLGIGLASLASAYVPTAFFQNYMGTSLLGMLVTLLFATVIEVCSEGSAPMAFELFRQTKALGNSFVFLMAGVATDYTEIGLLWQNVGKRTAIWLPVLTVPQVLILGYVGNLLF